MIIKRFFLGVLSAGLCYIGLAPAMPTPELNKQTAIKAAEKEPEGKAADTVFSDSVTSFSDELMKKSVTANEGKNLILSPLSVVYALTLCSNGASGETLAEFEALNGIPTDEMNEYLYSYTQQLAQTTESTVKTANSIWGNEEMFTIAEDFRTVGEKYYGAEAASVSYTDPATLNRINGWVSDKTDGMIPEALDELDPSTVMLLLNTVLFDGKWQKDYEPYQIREGVFNGAEVTGDNVEFMYSTEDTYFEVEGGVGFSKMYKDGYAFTAVLPDGDLDEFIAQMSLSEIAANALSGSGKVDAAIPKFEYESEIGLTDILSEMGLVKALSGKAELYGLSENGLPLYISQILQKAKVITNEHGTKAAAMTEIMVKMTSARPVEKKIVHLDRPFFYMILDTETGIPLFTGAVYNLGE